MKTYCQPKNQGVTPEIILQANNSEGWPGQGGFDPARFPLQCVHPHARQQGGKKIPLRTTPQPISISLGLSH